MRQAMLLQTLHQEVPIIRRRNTLGVGNNQVGRVGIGAVRNKLQFDGLTRFKPVGEIVRQDYRRHDLPGIHQAGYLLVIRDIPVNLKIPTGLKTLYEVLTDATAILIIHCQGDIFQIKI